MFRMTRLRMTYALAAIAMLLVAAPAVAQDNGFADAPTPADLDAPASSTNSVGEPEMLDPSDARAISEADIDYTFDHSTGSNYATQKSSDCGCDSCGCDDCGGNCSNRHGLLGGWNRLTGRGTCGRGGCSNGCSGGGKNQMDFEGGRAHDPNRTPAASGHLFQQYYAQPRGGGVAAQMYVAPYPVPAHVGHTYITYQAFEPSQFLYRHKRTYVRRFGPAGGTTKTCIHWW